MLTKQIPKALSRSSYSAPRLEFDSPSSKRRSRTPSPKPQRKQHLSPADEELFSGKTMNDASSTSNTSSSSKLKGRFKILGESKSASKISNGKEMTVNPKASTIT